MTLKAAFNRCAVLSLVIGSMVGFASALTISPARIELAADPGASVSGEFLVINDQDTDQIFYTSSENFEAQGESGTPSFSPSQEGLASWVDVEDKVILGKGKRLSIPFTVHVPKDADAGGHFAAIFLSTVPPSAKGGEVAVGAKIGMLVLLKVNGEIKEGGGVVSFGAKSGRVVTSLPVTLVYRFTNTGNDRANPVGEILIRNSLGITTEKLDANPSLGNILPNSTRRFEVDWGKGNKLSEGASFFEQVGYEARNFALGFYSAKVNVTFGAAGNSSASTIFFVFPWHLMTVVVVVILIAFFVGRYLVKRYNRWIINQARLSMKGE